MIIRYSEKAQEVEISANEMSLNNISRLLLKNEAEIVARTEGVEAAPYDRLLSRIRVSVVAGPLVAVQVENDTLLIQGDIGRLGILAKQVREFGRECREGDHLHIEYYEEHFYLSPTSIPLTICHL